MNTSRDIPNPRDASAFRFLDCDYHPETGVASLSYAFDNGPELVEQITFPHAPWPPEASRQACFRRALEILWLVAGVSYYKAGLSPRMELSKPVPAEGLDIFLTGLYVEGLAEFGYVNQVDVAARVRFPVSEAEPEAQLETEPGAGRMPVARPLILPERALVAMGGGKDSLVGLDLLKRAEIPVLPICVGGAALIRETVQAAGLPLLAIDRRLAPELSLMNQAGALNGHVPVTAINSAILLCASILYGCRYIVFANERSADEATRKTLEGREINHQYSKSSAFERAFREVIARQVSPDIEYFSILRPYSELAIVQRFAGMREFHSVYSSCNRNFHIDGPRITGRWCLDCPKCRFAALSLAVFMKPDEVAGIQGGDLLNDEKQEAGFRALCELGHEKPFECVGEAGESRAALASLGARDEWRQHAVVRALLPELESLVVPSLKDLLRPSQQHFIPPSIQKAVLVHEGGAGSLD
ncbi:MAG: endonuclease domain-containing protein [Xanthomonadales bacterium]|nr:endonuclease domain-containing protein [Xanthomonadales bacterium]MDH3925872.1 endonuclease domain-containing protein [Xanthomonadales bacterium]MDH3941485.1 endonuclease domain-containing protein [Xanthomonadales bacterium]MDH4001565.1 endonuclease domain-containing protein [Xanthomonadales bacterium]